jgi:thiazole synthase ThiGH ThiG subunit
MASAMKLGVQAGRLAYLAGRMEKSIMPAQVSLDKLVNYFKN